MKYNVDMQQHYANAAMVISKLKLTDDERKQMFTSVQYNLNYLKLHNRFVVDGKIKEKYIKILK